MQVFRKINAILRAVLENILKSMVRVVFKAMRNRKTMEFGRPGRRLGCHQAKRQVLTY